MHAYVAVCSRVPARASWSLYARQARDRWAWPRGPFLPLWSEYHYWPCYISAPINMEMRLIDPPNKPPRRYVAFPRARPLWFWTGSSNGRPNDRLMTLGNKVQAVLLDIEMILANFQAFDTSYCKVHILIEYF